MSPGNWGWPQWVMLVMMIVGCTWTIADHGKPRSPNNGWTAIVGSVISMWLLWAGGFWR